MIWKIKVRLKLNYYFSKYFLNFSSKFTQMGHSVSSAVSSAVDFKHLATYLPGSKDDHSLRTKDDHSSRSKDDTSSRFDTFECANPYSSNAAAASGRLLTKARWNTFIISAEADKQWPSWLIINIINMHLTVYVISIPKPWLSYEVSWQKQGKASAKFFHKVGRKLWSSF